MGPPKTALLSLQLEAPGQADERDRGLYLSGSEAVGLMRRAGLGVGSVEWVWAWAWDCGNGVEQAGQWDGGGERLTGDTDGRAATQERRRIVMADLVVLVEGVKESGRKGRVRRPRCDVLGWLRSTHTRRRGTSTGSRAGGCLPRPTRNWRDQAGDRLTGSECWSARQ